MAKTKRLHCYRYSKNNCEIEETTERYSTDMLRISDVEKDVPNLTEQQKVTKVERKEEEKADQFDFASAEVGAG